MSDRRSSEGGSSGIFQPLSDLVFGGEGPLTGGFEGEDSGSLAYKQSMALLKNREHCGSRGLQRRFAAAQVLQDLR